MALHLTTYTIQTTSQQDFYGVIGYLHALGLNPAKETGSLNVGFDFKSTRFYPNDLESWDEDDRYNWQRDLDKMKKLFPLCDWEGNQTFLPRI